MLYEVITEGTKEISTKINSKARTAKLLSEVKQFGKETELYSEALCRENERGFVLCTRRLNRRPADCINILR